MDAMATMPSLTRSIKPGKKEAMNVPKNKK